MRKLRLTLVAFALVFSCGRTMPAQSVPPVVQTPPPETGPIDDEDVQHQLTQLESTVWQLEVNQERMEAQILIIQKQVAELMRKR